MKKLFLIRHAKSSWEDPSLRDFDRPLNNRGKRDAPLMGEVLQRNGIVADKIISSPANRAYTTAGVFAQKTNYAASIEKDERIYGADVQSMIGIINEVPEHINSLFVFGHNPTFTYLAEYLADISIGNLPTTGVVGIEFEMESWAMISRGTGHCFLYDYPKNHK